MKPLLVGFGDSWTFGSELDRPQEQNWLYQLGQLMDVEILNMSTPASSIGHLVVQLFNFMRSQDQDQKLIFMVGMTGQSRYLAYNSVESEFVNVTPEAVYHTSNIHPSGRPPAVVENFRPVFDAFYKYIDNIRYREFIATSTIFTFQNYCRLKNIPVLFFSYFDKLYIDRKMIDNTTVLPDHMTYLLTGSEYRLPDIRNNLYFEGKLFHPNIDGHRRIAEILYEKYVQTYGQT